MRGHSEIIELVRTVDSIALCPVVLGELLAGFQRGRRRNQNEDELTSFMGSPRARVVDITDQTAIFYAAIVTSLENAGTPIPTNDIWIAASAMQHGLAVVTT